METCNRRGTHSRSPAYFASKPPKATEEALFALESVRAHLCNLPHKYAFLYSNLYASSILMKHGTKLYSVFNSTPLPTTNLEIMHWLLFRGANLRVWDEGRTLRPWVQFWVDMLQLHDTIPFIESEGTLSRLLLYGVDPHGLLKVKK